GDTLTIAETNILNGNTGALNLEGVYFVPKAAEGFAQGKKVYWDADGNPQGGVAGSGALTLVATDNLYAGIVYEATLTEAATVAVKING
ncbi:Bacteriophage VT1-Sakai, H0018 like protein, partial [Aduncisulcus paluster]